MNNVHLWQYFVIGGPAFLLGAVVAWAICREYERGLEALILNEPERTPEFIIPMRTVGKCHSAFLTFSAAIEAGKRALYLGPGYVVMPDTMYQELNEAKACAERTRRTAMYMLGMDCASAEGDASWFRRPS
jgi:hypothetical protein